MTPQKPVDLPPELWTKVLKNVDLSDLWSNARLFCRAWDHEIKNIVRLILYHGSGCQVSTWEEVVQGVKCYDRDFLYPIAPRNGTDSAYENVTDDEPLIWLRHQDETGSCSEYGSCNRERQWQWPVVVQYQAAGGIYNLRLNYECRLRPIDGSESVFSRHSRFDAEEGKANWMVYSVDSSKLDPEDRLGFAAVTIPLWQLVQLSLKGSVWNEEVDENSLELDDDVNPKRINGCQDHITYGSEGRL
jgi:hypothetical protein